MTRPATKIHCRRVHRDHDYRSKVNPKTAMCCVPAEGRNVVDAVRFLKTPESDRCRACNANVGVLVRRGRIKFVKVEK